MFLTKARILGNSNKTPTYTYTLSLDANGGSNAYVTSLSSANAQDSWSGSATSADVLVQPGDVVSVVTSAPTRSGYVFQGWADSSSGSVVFSSTSFNISVESFTGPYYRRLYAKWVTAATYTLNFNANGGSGAPSSQSVTTAATPLGYTFTIPSTTPTRSNYTFAGWATSSTGSAVYQPGGTVVVTSTTTLYAAWTPNYTSQTLSGSGTFTVPDYVTKLRVTIKGGGGGSGSSVAHKKGSNDNTGDVTATGGAGGTGGYQQVTITTTAGSAFSYSVGAAGSAASGPTNYVSSAKKNGGTGGTSTFGSYSSTGGGGGNGGYLSRSGSSDAGYSYTAYNGSSGSAGSPSGDGGSGAGTNTAVVPAIAGKFTYAAGWSGSSGSIVVEYGSGIQ